MTRYEKDMLKIEKYGAACKDGKFLVYILYEKYDRSDGMAYFFDGRHKRRRIFTSTFYRWLDEDKAVRVAQDEFNKN